MEIDAFTFVAQLLNFALLVFLLRRFLYRPIQDAMKLREATIKKRLVEAEEQQRVSEETEREYRERVRSLDEERDEILSAARREAEELESELAQTLRLRMSQRESEWRDSLERRGHQELQSFRSDVRAEIVATIRNTLAELADESLEQKIVDRFLREIATLSPEVVERLVGDEGEVERRPPLTVVTSFELDPNSRDRIEQVLLEHFVDARLAFEVDATRLAGIELRCHGHRLGWSLGDHIETLDDTVRERMRELTREREDVVAAG